MALIGGGSSPNPINVGGIGGVVGIDNSGNNSGGNSNRDKLIEKYKEIIKNNLDNFRNIIGDNGGGDNGGYIDNPIVEPEAQEPEVVEAQPEEQTVKQDTVEIEPVAGLLQENNETKEEVKDNTFSVADVFAPKATQANEDYASQIKNGQGADSDSGTSANDAWNKKLKEIYGEDYDTTTTEPIDNSDSGTPYAAGLNTNVKTPEEYDPNAGVRNLGNVIKDTATAIGKGIYNPIANSLATVGLVDPHKGYRSWTDSNGNEARFAWNDKTKEFVPFIWDAANGKWFQADYDPNTKTYSPSSISTVGNSAGQYQNDDWAKAYEVGLLRGNPTGAVTTEKTGTYFTGSGPTASTTTAGNPISNKDAQPADNHALRGFDTNESNTPYTTDVGTKGNPISDVQVGDTAVHYVDKEGAVHSVPLSTEEGQAVVDNYFDIDPTEVTVGDTTVSYFDENGDYHVVPLASEKGQEIQKYADAMGDYGSIEANYAKAIEAVGEYNANNSYPTVGTTDNPINADELINTIADMKVNPMYAGWTDEQIRAEAVRIIQSRFDQTNGKPFSWSEDLPLIEGVPLYNTETGTGNALYDSIMNDGRTVSGFSSQEDITYQDSILHYFDNPEYSNGGGLPTENGAGFRGVVIPESCQDIVATSKYGALDERNGDKIETVVMSDEKYTEAVLDFVEANPQISAMLEAGKLTLDGIIAHFFKLNTAKPSGGSSYRGYGGYYRGGGGGGYRGGGGSSGGSSNSAGSTTQNQQRVYNIMKNWSF